MPAPDAGVPVSRVVACAVYADGRRVAEVSLEDISEVLRAPDRFVWVAVDEPSAALLIGEVNGRFHRQQAVVGEHGFQESRTLDIEASVL